MVSKFVTLLSLLVHATLPVMDEEWERTVELQRFSLEMLSVSRKRIGGVCHHDRGKIKLVDEIGIALVDASKKITWVQSLALIMLSSSVCSEFPMETTNEFTVFCVNLITFSEKYLMLGTGHLFH
jgi:hypothetical protein